MAPPPCSSATGSSPRPHKTATGSAPPTSPFPASATSVFETATLSGFPPSTRRNYRHRVNDLHRMFERIDPRAAGHLDRRKVPPIDDRSEHRCISNTTSPKERLA